MNQVANMLGYKSVHTTHWRKASSGRSLPHVEFRWGHRRFGKLWKISTNQRTNQGFFVLNCMILTLSARNIKRRDSPLWAEIIVNSFIKRCDLSWTLNLVKCSHRYYKGQDGRRHRDHPGEQDMTGTFPCQVEGRSHLTSVLLHIHC